MGKQAGKQSRVVLRHNSKSIKVFKLSQIKKSGRNTSSLRHRRCSTEEFHVWMSSLITDNYSPVMDQFLLTVRSQSCCNSFFFFTSSYIHVLTIMCSFIVPGWWSVWRTWRPQDLMLLFGEDSQVWLITQQSINQSIRLYLYNTFHTG